MTKRRMNLDTVAKVVVALLFAILVFLNAVQIGKWFYAMEY